MELMNQIVEEDDQDWVTIAKDNDGVPDAMSEDDEVESSYSFDFFAKNDLIKVHESSYEYSIVRTGFFSGIEENSSKKIKILAIHKTFNSSFSAKVKAKNFQILAKAVARKCCGDANIKYAWYSASKDEICEILKHGFSWYIKTAENQYCYRTSIYLFAAKFSSDSVLGSKLDETGVRHLLLCRVILGKQELVTGNCNDWFHPSSPEFDSGVDDLSAPRKYIIWSTYMNSHILPCYIISFGAPYEVVVRAWRGDWPRDVR